MAQLAHCAEAFYLQSECCFRLIHVEDGTGHAQHCPYFTEWRGRIQDRAGKWWAVESCDGHRADLDSDLDSVQRLTGSTRLRSELSLEPLKRARWTEGIQNRFLPLPWAKYN